MDTQFEKIKNMFYGVYMIIPGQYALLDNQFISYDKNNLRIIVRGGMKDAVYNYSINSNKELYFKGKPIKAIEIRVDNLTITNTTGANNLENLFNNVLGMRSPTTLYITFDQETGLFSLLNSQYSNIFTMQKMSDAYEAHKL